MGIVDRSFLLGATLPLPTRRLAVALVFLLHVVLFWLVYPGGGVRVVGPLSVVPVVGAAWLLGARGGALAGVAVLLLNTGLIGLASAGAEAPGRNVLNYAVLVGVGGLVGWLRDLNVRVREQARLIEAQARVLAEQARLDGAIKTARLAAHELNNRLQVVETYAQLLPRRVDGEAAVMASTIATAATDAGALLNRLQGIIRFEETTMGGVALLDLDASTGPSNDVVVAADAPRPGVP